MDPDATLQRKNESHYNPSILKLFMEVSAKVFCKLVKINGFKTLQSFSSSRQMQKALSILHRQ